MSEMCSQGRLQSIVDAGHGTNKGPFVGLENVADAVEVYMQLL